MNDDELQQSIVLAAIGAAGEIKGDVRGWQTRVAEYTGHVAAMLRPPLPGREDDAVTPLVQARKVLDSAVFRAEFVDWEDDVNRKTGVMTHRLLVRFKSDTMSADETEGDGTEHLRTEPSWTRAGWVMQRLVKSLSEGQPVNVYKHKEGFDGTDDKGRAMKKNVRVLAHLEVVGRPPESRPVQGVAQDERPASATAQSDAGQDRREQHPARSQRDAGASPPQAAPASESHGEHYAAVQERLEQLTARQRVAWAALCRGKGVQNFMDPLTTDDLDKVLVAFSDLEKKERAMSTPSEQREKELARSHNSQMPSPFSTKVVGVTFTDHYPDNLMALRDLADGDEPPVAVLIRNPDNRFDANAIEVHVPSLGEAGMVGHLTGPIAARIAPEMDAGGRWAGEIESVLVTPGHEDRPGISIKCARVREEET